jgi:hypothetical protein
MSTSPNFGTAAGDDLIRFAIRDGIRLIKCAVSNEALEAASGLAEDSAPTLRRRSFDRFRTLIHAAATLRLKALPSDFVGPILLTTRDLRCVPPERGFPVFGVAARPPAQRAKGVA